MRTMSEGTPTIQKIREAAAKKGVDPRSVVKLLNGGAVRGLAGERAREALVELGVQQPEAPHEPKAA